MKANHTLALILILSLNSLCFYSQETAESRNLTDKASGIEVPVTGNFDFFASEQPLEMTLCFDIRAFLKSKNEYQYFNARLTIREDDHDSLVQNIRIRARGNNRLDVCTFPPILLKFSGEGKDDKEIQKKGSLKLVTHCNPEPVFENYILKEYLAYKLLNLVTPFSFRTRLTRMQYIDNQHARKPVSAFGFLVENQDQMAERNQAVVINKVTVPNKNLDSREMTRISLFNYMIGNTDWATQVQHNVKMLTSKEILSNKVIPVSYDFDYSGFVGTSYSAPSDQLPIHTVTERYYMGVCSSQEDLEDAINEFKGLQSEFIKTIDEFQLLPKGYKKQAESYINSFFNGFRNQNAMMAYFSSNCKPD